ncbi:ComEC/Rec2 family competence protein [Psychrobacter sanguinis]|uniref:ComEC/Rec2 family competence protein n=1 Tax=Psychrobacter sanguinis TaxID=861445 RepID=UPI0028AC165E|nr:ComEC/Rec2 family competence protein [Psychrobacter sanguinis]
MIWLAGFAAIGLMLAILELDPSQLYTLSTIRYQVNSEHWQAAVYFVLAIITLLWLGFYLLQLVAKRNNWQHTSLFCSVSSLKKSPYKKPSQILKPQRFYLAPLIELYHQGFIASIVKISIGLLFLLAVFCHSVAQRLAFIESSPQKNLYVQAMVTPIGLSDKRLKVDDKSVVQGYRQLVQLSDIKFDSLQVIGDKAETVPSYSNQFGSTIDNSQRINPFHQPINTDVLIDKASVSLNQAKTVTGLQILPNAMTVMLQSYQIKDKLLNKLAAGQQLRMKLALIPLELKDKNNPDEFDEYRWLSSRHATAKAFIVDTNYQKVEEVSNLTLHQKIDVMRFRFREHFLQLMNERTYSNNFQRVHATDFENTDSGNNNSNKVDANSEHSGLNQDGVAVTLSLLTGDRSLISDETTALYRFGGISHLLAISGTHVLFLSILCATGATAFINRFMPRIYHFLPRWQCAFIIAAITAFGYALFAGFDVPALRTACMLLLVGVMRYLLAVPAIFKMLLLLAVIMAWSDIFVLWQAGFWLSFVAVAVLVAYSQRWERKQDAKQSSQVSQAFVSPTLSLAGRLGQQLAGLFKLQLWMSIALLPISLWLFGKVSLWGFAVNLFAIGLFGWIIVPLNLLASVLFIIFPNNALADSIWSLLFWILDLLHRLLLTLQEILQYSGWVYTDISVPLLGLFLLLVLPWLLPKGMLSRLLSMAPLVAIAALAYANNDTLKDSVQITVLNPKDFNYAASLIHTQQQAWLLLSEYDNKYKVANASLTALQQQQLVQNLYDQLQEHGISHLTGVIIQTQTAGLAPVVRELNRHLPLSYYWQAGLANHKQQVNKALSGSTLTAQSCHSGKQWPQQKSERLFAKELPTKRYDTDDLSLKVLTGWQQVKDSGVWDCVIELSTTQAIYLNEKGSNEQLRAAIRPSNSDSMLAKQSKVDDKRRTKPKVEKNSVVIYSSVESQLGKLWELMCPAQELKVGDSSVQFKPTINEAYWLTPSQSVLDPELIVNFSAKDWKITGESMVPAKLSLTESYLYWQQAMLSNNSE